MRMTPEMSPAPPSQFPGSGSSANAADPSGRPAGWSDPQLMSGQPEKTPSLVSVQPRRPLRLVEVLVLDPVRVCPSGQRSGSFWLRIGWKLHCAVGSRAA